MPTVEDRVLDLLASERRANKAELQPEDRLLEDLGMDGDDAVDFFKSFGEMFSVDLDALWHHWKLHFSPEGFTLLPFPRRLVPITVREVTESAIAGRWIKSYEGAGISN
jgi:acyl carrier protein